MTSQAFQQIATTLADLQDWEQRHRAIIDLGRALPPLSELERTPENRVRGCASQVWLIVEPSTSGTSTIGLRGGSDSLLVQGIIALLLALYSDQPAEEIIGIDAVAVLDGMGLTEYLTPQRSNGLAAMVARIQDAARSALV